MLTLRPWATLDREIRQTYSLRVHVRDSSPSPQRSVGPDGSSWVEEDVLDVELQVQDVNDHVPHFERDAYSVAVDEQDDVVDRVLVRVRALDEDAGSYAAVKYSLLPLDNGGGGGRSVREWLQVNELSGELSNRVPLDCESELSRPEPRIANTNGTCMRLEAVVVARDGGGLEGRTRVSVEVRAQNEYRPAIELRPATPAFSSSSASASASSYISSNSETGSGIAAANSNSNNNVASLELVEHSAPGTLVGFMRAHDRDSVSGSHNGTESLRCSLMAAPIETRARVAQQQQLFQLRALLSATGGAPAVGGQELQFAIHVAQAPNLSSLLDRESRDTVGMSIRCTDGTFNTTLDVEVLYLM